MILRLAELHDAPAIAALSKSEIERGLDWSWKPARVSKAIADPETNVVVATEGQELIGFGIMVYRYESAYLCLFAVEPSRRRRGIGSAILAWLERVAAVAGIQRLALEARADNVRALSFYEKHGYRRAAIITGMYQGLADGVRLEKPLLSSNAAGVQ